MAPLEEEMSLEVKGRDNMSGMPRKVLVNSVEIRDLGHGVLTYSLLSGLNGLKASSIRHADANGDG